MKTYCITLMMKFNKCFKIDACNKEEALDFLKDIFFNTNLIKLTDAELYSVNVEVESDDTEPCERCGENCNSSHSTDDEYLYDELY